MNSNPNQVVTDEQGRRRFHGAQRPRVPLLLIDLKNAHLTDETAMALRIEAKLAHATLLHRATFASDGMDAVRAERLAHRNVATCTKLVAGYLEVQLDDGNPNADPTLGKPESAIALLE